MMLALAMIAGTCTGNASDELSSKVASSTMSQFCPQHRRGHSVGFHQRTNEPCLVDEMENPFLVFGHAALSPEAVQNFDVSVVRTATMASGGGWPPDDDPSEILRHLGVSQRRDLMEIEAMEYDHDMLNTLLGMRIPCPPDLTASIRAVPTELRIPFARFEQIASLETPHDTFLAEIKASLAGQQAELETSLAAFQAELEASLAAHQAEFEAYLNVTPFVLNAEVENIGSEGSKEGKVR